LSTRAIPDASYNPNRTAIGCQQRGDAALGRRRPADEGAVEKATGHGYRGGMLTPGF